jgi:hypothetical protein
MTRASDLERRLRTAFEAEAARTRPHPRAWTENARRLRRSRRRRFLAVPATAAATAAVILVAVALGPEPPAHRPQPRHPAATLPSDLDPRYWPTGPTALSTNAPRMAWWFAGRGANTLLCWRLTTGGGDCRRPPARPAGRHAAYVGTANLGRAVSGRGLALMVYGVTDGRSGSVALTLPQGTRHVGTTIVHSGLPWKIWQIIIYTDDMSKFRAGATAIVSDAQGVLVSAAAGTTSPSFSASPFPASILLRPLTVGAPVFSYRTARTTVTMRAFVDGDKVGLGSTESTFGQPGRGNYFGSVKEVRDGIGAPWVYGFLSPRMARVVLRLADGRTVPAKIVQVGRHRVFAVQLIDEPPGGRSRHDMILTYDAAGTALASWRA